MSRAPRPASRPLSRRARGAGPARVTWRSGRSPSADPAGGEGRGGEERGEEREGGGRGSGAGRGGAEGRRGARDSLRHRAAPGSQSAALLSPARRDRRALRGTAPARPGSRSQRGGAPAPRPRGRAAAPCGPPPSPPREAPRPGSGGGELGAAAAPGLSRGISGPPAPRRSDPAAGGGAGSAARARAPPGVRSSRELDARPSSLQVKAARGKMYQGLALAPSPGQAAYADSGAFLHAPSAGSPVFVPPARVPSMLPYLPACEPGPQAPGLAAHPGWAQAAADSSAFGSGSPHPPAAQPAAPTAFPFPHSPPGPGGGGAGTPDAGAYQGALLAREQYPAPLRRPVSAPYPAAYPAYVSTEVAPSWTSGPFDGSVLHGLQSHPAGFPGRRATFGECETGAGTGRVQTRTLRMLPGRVQNCGDK